MSNLLYQITETTTMCPSNRYFNLHNHDEYEIFLFLEGDSKYIVEANTYFLEPGDIIIIRKHEMHRVFHNSEKKYKRIVIMVSPDFFKENNCAEYEAQFIRPIYGTGNKIEAKAAKSIGLYDAIMKLELYSENFQNINTPAVRAAIIEILFLINKTIEFSGSDITNNRFKDVINYINNNFTDDITLEELERNFYISKYHLCRVFKQITGHTVHHYITHKRITRVRELCGEGKKISEAVMLSGFGNYSSFYRAYVKEFGSSPHLDINTNLIPCNGKLIT